MATSLSVILTTIEFKYLSDPLHPRHLHVDKMIHQHKTIFSSDHFIAHCYMLLTEFDSNKCMVIGERERANLVV